MPPDPPSCKRLRRSGKIYFRAYIFKIARYAPEVDEGQPQEDTDDTVIALGQGESYFKYKAQKY